MNAYGIIAIILGVIFTGIMVYVFYAMSKPTCASNQQYISCDGGAKQCYPICGDDQQLNCGLSACVPICGDDEQVYGPGTDPACSGDYFCGPVCDASAGEVFDCDSQTCQSQCGSGQIVHQCGSEIQCADSECQDGFSWDCDTASCQPDTDTTFSCNPTADVIPELTTESCDTGSQCCYSILNQAAACFQTPDTYWFARGIAQDSDGNYYFQNVDIIGRVFGENTTVPYQGDSAYNTVLNMCDTTAGFSRPFSTKNPAIPRGKKKAAPRGDPNYKCYAQNYTGKYLKVYTDQDNYDNPGTTILPPNMKTNDKVELRHSSRKDKFYVYGLEVADSADGPWPSKESQAVGKGTYDYMHTIAYVPEGDKIVFQPIDCVANLSDLNSAQVCS